MKCPQCGYNDKRSDPQNRGSHGWYRQIAHELREGTDEDVKSECKLRFGVPILRAEDVEFREWYDGLIKRRFNYEEKLDLMRHIPVTSLMTKAQMTTYLEQVQAHYATRGVQLEFAEPTQSGNAPTQSGNVRTNLEGAYQHEPMPRFQHD